MSKQRNYNNSRVMPEAVENLRLQPQANPVNKEIKYQPMVGDAAKLNATAQGLAKLGQGLVDIDPIITRKAQENVIAAEAQLEEKNRKDWANVSKKVTGMAKFNPYNKRAYNQILSGQMAREALIELKKDRDFYTRDYNEAQAIIDNARITLADNYKQAGIHQGDYAPALEKFAAQTEQMKMEHAEKYAEYEFKLLQNKSAESLGDDFATAVDNGLPLAEAAINAEKAFDGLGWTGETKATVIMNGLQAYVAKYPEASSVDVEKFMQTYTVDGEKLSSYVPNASVQMRQFVKQIKRGQYEDASLDLQIEKLRLEKETLNANAELYKLMSDPNVSDEEILNKANELITQGNMESIGFKFLGDVDNDKRILLDLRTATTNPEIYHALLQKYFDGTLTADDVKTASRNKQLSPKDAYSFFNTLQTEAQQDYSEQMTALKELYLDNKPVIDIGEDNKVELMKSVYTTISDPNLNKAEKAEALRRIKGVAEYMDKQNQFVQSKDPMKLLTKEAMQNQRVHDQNAKEAHRYLTQMGLFRGRFGEHTQNFRVSSPMQAKRTVVLKDPVTGEERVQTSKHNGTDIETYTGRAVVAPVNGTVLASGFEPSMGNYILFQYGDGDGRVIKLMHLQSADRAKAGTKLKEGELMCRVGNTGNLDLTPQQRQENKIGILHVECFNKQLILRDTKEFFTGK